MKSKYSFQSPHFRIQMRFKLKQIQFKNYTAFRILVILYTIGLYVDVIP